MSPQNITTASFGIDFETHYAKNKKQWAGCYRKHPFVNTNMYVEAIHRVLRYIYMKGKVNKRLGNCTYVLLRFARDKGYDSQLAWPAEWNSTIVVD